MKIEDIEKAVKLKEDLQDVNVKLDFLENFKPECNQRNTLLTIAKGRNLKDKWIEFAFENDRNLEIMLISYQASKYKQLKKELEAKIKAL